MAYNLLIACCSMAPAVKTTGQITSTTVYPLCSVLAYIYIGQALKFIARSSLGAKHFCHLREGLKFKILANCTLMLHFEFLGSGFISRCWLRA